MSAKKRNAPVAVEPQEPNRPDFIQFIRSKDRELHQRFSDAISSVEAVVGLLSLDQDQGIVSGDQIYALIKPHLAALNQMEEAISAYFATGVRNREESEDAA